MKKLNFKRLRLLLLLFISITISCQSELKNQSNLVFRYNEHADITSLDPAFAKDQRNIWAVHQLYNTLVGLDNKMNINPEIAKSWSISQDGLVYRFLLRDDVFFHQSDLFNNKHKLDADDVIYSLKRLSDPNLASPGSWIMNPVKSIKKIEKNTIEIRLKQNFPAFLGLLSMKYCSIIPEEAKSGTINFRTNPIGTGPFMFKRWIAQEKLVFRKNPLYFERDSLGNNLPYLEAISITFLPDKQSEFMQFIQGNLDFMSGLDVSYKDELLTAEGRLKSKYKERITLEKSPYLNTEYIGFFMSDSTSAVFHKEIRKAVNYAFDRKKMLKYLRNGIGKPANYGFIPQGLPGYGKTDGFKYQPEIARRLMTAYKSKTGNQNPEITISTNAQYVDLIEFIQAEMRYIGLKVNIDVLPASTLRQKRSAGQLEAFRASWIADYPDAQNYLSLFYSKNKAPNGPNYTRFDSKVYDSLYKKMLATNTLEEKLELYEGLDSLIIDNAIIVPLYYDEVVRFKQNNIKGLEINSTNLLELKSVSKK